MSRFRAQGFGPSGSRAVSLRDRIAYLESVIRGALEENRILLAYVESRRVLLDRETKRWKAVLKAARSLRRRRAV
jgi:hypothetical protein